jgi:YidC/Oxa1 family membrane protein insertase
VIIVGLLSYYQQRQMTARQSASAVNPQQQMIMNLMPIFFGFISLTFASGLIIYFLVQNIFRIAQNAYITRKFYGDEGDVQDSSEDPRKPSLRGSKGVIDTSETKVSNRPKPAVNNAPEKSITPPKAKPTPSVKQKPAAQAPAGRPKPPVKNDGARPSRPAPKKK